MDEKDTWYNFREGDAIRQIPMALSLLETKIDDQKYRGMIKVEGREIKYNGIFQERFIGYGNEHGAVLLFARKIAELPNKPYDAIIGSKDPQVEPSLF